MSIYVKGRTTAAGTEYWNKTLKRVELFAEGTAPDEVQTEGMVGQYSASGKVNTGVDLTTAKDFVATVMAPNLDEMDIDALRAFAAEQEIDIPGNMKKVETIREHIAAELNG